jgi:hypothetical protein
MNKMLDGRLLEWLKHDLRDVGHGLSDEALLELIENAKRIITLYQRRPEKLRPSAAARELNSLATHLNKAAKAAERLGDQGMLLIVAMSEANLDAGEFDMRRHVLYLQRMASWSRRAAEAADQQSRAARDHKGGNTPDQNLRELVTLLLIAYQEILGIRPSHTIDLSTGLVERGASAFIKQALATYWPDHTFKHRLIDEIVRRSLIVRDLEFFDPSPLPSS